MNALPVCVSLMGPTASGKTDLAVWLCQRFPLEIVSVDSALVYRDMNIGTAKPDAATLARAPHHLINVVDPTESYSAGRFRADALALMADIGARGRVPLLVGGTMLYFKALKGGLDELPAANPVLRADLDARAARDGWPALHRQLAELDPKTAARLQPNDAQRIQRALEVCLLSGQPMSALHRGGAGALPWRMIEIALVPGERGWLHERINQRFRMMLDAGLVDEVRRLRAKYPLTPDMASMRCVGYRQTWQYLDGAITLKQLYDTGAAATRQLAKRQMTWLRGWPDARQFDCMAPDLIGRIGGFVEAAVATA
ncbi:MAG: tRNA (adenosine(37)-N6)-dimethylallyltransferase MiaA [Hydrogenophilales bacterium]|nr:tRNA (adenosine(37)-N6)-dimethylallyltransferase MiaA [Hydrogenophilales bacterium]